MNKNSNNQTSSIDKDDISTISKVTSELMQVQKRASSFSRKKIKKREDNQFNEQLNKLISKQSKQQIKSSFKGFVITSSRKIKTNEPSIKPSTETSTETSIEDQKNFDKVFNSNKLNYINESNLSTEMSQNFETRSSSSFIDIETISDVETVSDDDSSVFKQNFSIDNNLNENLSDDFLSNHSFMISNRLAQNQPVTNCYSNLNNFVDSKLLENNQVIESTIKDEDIDQTNSNCNQPINTEKTTLQFCDQSILCQILTRRAKVNSFLVTILSLDEFVKEGNQMIRLGLSDGFCLCQYCMIIRPLAERICVKMLNQFRILEITSYKLLEFSFVYFLEILNFNYHGIDLNPLNPNLFVLPPIYPDDVVLKIEQSTFSKILCYGKFFVSNFYAECIQINEESINDEDVFWLALSDGINVFPDFYISLKRISKDKLIENGLSTTNCLLYVTNYQDKPFNRRIAIELIEFTFMNGSFNRTNRLNWIRTIPFISSSAISMNTLNK